MKNLISRWDSSGAIEFIQKELKKYGEETIPYNDFCVLVDSVAHSSDMSVEEATKLVYKFVDPSRIGTQEHPYAGNKYQGQKNAVNFGSRPAGDLAEPKRSSAQPLSRIELVSYQKGDRVYVNKDDQAPWGAAYTGFIVSVNSDNTLDILDEMSGVVNISQPARLLANPKGEGADDKRVPTDKNFEGRSIAEVRRDKNYFSTPAGHMTDDVKNQQSNFYKEAKQISVDFDGTITDKAHGREIGAIRPDTKEALRKLKEMGYNVSIFSARANSDFGKKQIAEWLKAHGVPFDNIAESKPGSDFFIDDKAISIGHGRNWNDVLTDIKERSSSIYSFLLSKIVLK